MSNLPTNSHIYDGNGGHSRFCECSGTIASNETGQSVDVGDGDVNKPQTAPGPGAVDSSQQPAEPPWPSPRLSGE